MVRSTGSHSPADRCKLRLSAQYVSSTSVMSSACNLTSHGTANGGGYGQNIGAGFTPEQIGFMITNAMYDGEFSKYPTPYGNDNPDLSNFASWGHFSQIVWAGTTQVGCATQYCPQGLQNTGGGVPPYFTVCNYSPPGKHSTSVRGTDANKKRRQLSGGIQQRACTIGSSYHCDCVV